MEIKKIVVGVDFSDEAENAARTALNVARHTGAELVLVYVGTVLERSRGVAPTGAVYEWEKVINEQLAEDRERLEALRDRLSGQGPEVSHMVIDGFPDTGLCDAAKELGADLLLTGTHGRTGIKRFLLGSVAERVVRLYDRNVMVVRGSGAGGAGGFRKILVPTDFSEHAEEALRTALVVAAPGATVELFHAWQLPVVATDITAGPVLASLEESAKIAGQRLLDKYQREGVNLTFEARQTGPAHGISERLSDGYDLVVLGSHGRRGVRRFLLGSVAETTVRHAPCSVIVVHMKDE